VHLVRMSLRVADSKESHVSTVTGARIARAPNGIWERMAVSPPRSPPSQFTFGHLPLPPEFSLSSAPSPDERPPCPAGIGLLGLSLPAAPRFSTACSEGATNVVPTQRADGDMCSVDSVTMTWGSDIGSASLVLFSQHEDDAVVIHRNEYTVISNSFATVPQSIFAESVHWKPLARASNGSTAHQFGLVDERGARVLKLQAVLSPDGEKIAQLTFLQPHGTAIGVCSGLVDRSARLCICNPEARIEQMQRLNAQMKNDSEHLLGYVPTEEAVVGPKLRALPLVVSLSSSMRQFELYKSADIATQPLADPRAAWNATKDLLVRLSAPVANCVDMHAQNELNRIKAPAELFRLAKTWREHV